MILSSRFATRPGLRGLWLGALAYALVACGGGSGEAAPAATADPDPAPTQGASLPPPVRANQAPVPADDDVASGTGGEIMVSVLANDVDPDGDAVSLVAAGVPTVGSATIDDNGTAADRTDDRLRLVLPAAFTGSVMVAYTVEDDDGASAEGVVRVTVGQGASGGNALNAAPTAQPDSARTTPGSAVMVDVLANDDDADGDERFLLSFSAAASGVVTRDDRGTDLDASDDRLIYTPAPGFSGEDKFEYRVSDGLATAAAEVTVTVRAQVTTPPQQICGQVMLGPVDAAEVNVFELDAGGASSGAPIVTTQTDANGQWCASLPANRPDYLVVSTGGAYFDPADSGAATTGLRQIDLAGATLEGLLFADASTTAVTPLSSALVRKIRAQSFGSDFALVAPVVRAQGNDAYGFDPFATPAVNPLDPAEATLASRELAMALGGTASALNRLAVALGQEAPDAGLLDALIDDLVDCGLDGQRDGVIIDVMSVVPAQPLPGNVSLNLEILRFRNNQFAAYEETPVVQVDSAPCLVSAIAADTTPPRFVALPDNIALSDPQGLGVQIDDGRLQPFVDGAIVTDNRPQPVDLVLRLASGGALPARFPAGVTRVVFEATDAAGNVAVSDEREITVTTSLPPQSVDDAATTSEDVDVTVDVLANDVAPGLPLNPATVQVLSVSGAASVQVDTANGALVVTPLPDAFGTVVISYDVANTDGLRGAATTVTVTVTPRNDDPPQAQSDSASVAENDGVAIDVLANDSDPDEGGLTGATVEIETPPTNGVAVVDAATQRIVYTPNTNFDGSDSFRYRVRDTSDRLSLDVLVSIDVAGINQPPVATASSVTLDEDIAVDIALTATDPEGRLDADSVTITQLPTAGTLTEATTGTWRYQPDSNVSGVDSFAFTYADTDGLISAPAVVTLNVVAVNDVPLLAADVAATPERVPVVIDVLANDSDVEGSLDAGSVEIVRAPTNGIVTVEADGQLRYASSDQFNGLVTFSYRAADTDGSFGEPAEVTVSVAAVDDDPVAGDDAVVVLAGASVDINVLANDSDPENALDAGSVTVVDMPLAPVTVDPVSGVIRVDASARPAGRDTFTYRVSDVAGNTSNLASVVVDVWPATDTDFDGVARDIEIAVGTDPDVADSHYVHIDPDADPALSDGSSWATAYVSPQAAVTAGALDGNAGGMTFVLMAGNASATAPWRMVFDGVCDDLVLIGSIDYLVDTPQRDVDDAQWTTTLGAANGERPLTLRNCANVHAYGLRIAGARNVTEGAGALIEASTVVLNDPEFSDNRATVAGGALALTPGGGTPAATLTIIDGLFEANQVQAADGTDGRGGALDAQDGTTLILDGTRFVRNVIEQAGVAGVTGGGGGLHSDNATLTATSAVFAGNRSDSVGGGLVLRGQNGVVSMRHSNISGNEAQELGGGVYLEGTRSNVVLSNSLITANYADIGGGLYTQDALDTAITNFSAGYNYAGDGGAVWVSNGSPRFDDNVLAGNTAQNSADTIGGTVATMFNLNANNNVTDAAWAGFFGTNNLTADPDFTQGYYLNHTPGSLSPAIDHSQTFQSDDASIMLQNRFTDAAATEPDTGALDAGYHYEAGSAGVADRAPAVGSVVDPGGQYHVITIRPEIGGVAVGPGRRVFVSGVDNTAQPRLYRYTTAFSDPLGTGRSTPALDKGDGTYEIYVQAPFDTDFFLELWIDTLVGAPLVRYSVRIDST